MPCRAGRFELCNCSGSWTGFDRRFRNKREQCVKWRVCNLVMASICGVVTSFPLNAQSQKTQAQKAVALTAPKHWEVTGAGAFRHTCWSEELHHDSLDKRE